MAKFTEIDKKDLRYMLHDCISLIEYMFDNDLIPDSLIERAYNTMANSQTIHDAVDNKTVL